MSQSIYFAGTDSEMAHHAAPILRSPLAAEFAIQVSDPDAILDQAQPADLVVVYSEHFDRFRNLVSTLKSRRVASLYMIDGILEWRNAWENLSDEPACPFAMRPVLADKVACIGDAQARVLSTWGNANKVEVIGVPRFDSLTRAFRNSMKKNSSIQLSEREELKILVATAKCPGFTPEQVSTTVNSLRNLLDWTTSHPRFHGRTLKLTWRLTGELSAELGVEETISNRSLLEQLEQTDLVITTPSTLMLEAMLMDLPVILLNYHPFPVYVPSAWQIASPEQMQANFESLFDRKSFQRRMFFQRQILLDQLAVGLVDQPLATERFAELARQMLASAKRQTCQDDQQPLEFPESMLMPPARGGSWNQAAMYPGYEEFENNDYSVLQAELAHSRREIDLLHRDLAQVKSELGEAHSIFDQIHQHPIAGPVVRIRQRVLDWLNRHSKQQH